MTPAIQAALAAAAADPTPESLAALLRELPLPLLLSEQGRRCSALRTTHAGPTGNWSKHNPNVPNCRCVRCHRKRHATTKEGHE